MVRGPERVFAVDWPLAIDRLLHDDDAEPRVCAEGYWEHAEEFLSMVETVAKDHSNENHSHPASILTAMLKDVVRWPPRTIEPEEVKVTYNIPASMNYKSAVREVIGPLYDFADLRALLFAARRAVLVDCWSFLRGSKYEVTQGVMSERWFPYVEWAKSLTEDDTIVTFNYDELPEYLIGCQKMKPHGSKLKIICPTKVHSYLKASQDVVPVFKMHGSTNWTLTEKGEPETSRTFGATQRSLVNLGIEPLLAMPGPTKFDHYASYFEDIWNAAMDAIRKTEEINFIGYRLPPSDVYSQSRILEAVSMATQPVRINVCTGHQKSGYWPHVLTLRRQ
jgi:hypothetical protein